MLGWFSSSRGDVDLMLVEPFVVEVSVDNGWMAPRPGVSRGIGKSTVPNNGRCQVSVLTPRSAVSSRQAAGRGEFSRRNLTPPHRACSGPTPLKMRLQ